MNSSLSAIPRALALLILLISLCSYIESREASPSSSARKPPYNGSMFGKRSIIAPGFNQAPEQDPLQRLRSTYVASVKPGTYGGEPAGSDLLALMAWAQCVADKMEFGDSDLVARTLCLELVMNRSWWAKQQ